jgi:hypothetical protein
MDELLTRGRRRGGRPDKQVGFVAVPLTMYFGVEGSFSCVWRSENFSSRRDKRAARGSVKQ